MSKIPPPHDGRSRIVYFIWNNLPRFVLLAMILCIIFLMIDISEKKRQIASETARQQQTKKPPASVITLELLPQTIRDKINLPGVIEPWTRLRLMSKIGGTVNEVLVSEGDVVDNGDLIARIDDQDYKIAFERAEAAYNLAKIDLQRNETLQKQNAISLAVLDASRTKMQTSKADYTQAKLLLQRTEITSPMEGVVRRLHIEEGSQLGIGDPVGEILDMRRMKAVIGIPESDVAAIRKLDTVEVTVQAAGSRKYTGKKHFLAPSPENSARLYNLELEIGNSDNSLFSGMFCRANIVKETREDALVVPIFSVISRNDVQYVFVEEGGLAKRRDVKLGIMEGWMVQVSEGLKKGDKVIVEGHRDIEDGSSVEVVKRLNSIKGIGQ